MRKDEEEGKKEKDVDPLMIRKRKRVGKIEGERKNDSLKN